MNEVQDKQNQDVRPTGNLDSLVATAQRAAQWSATADRLKTDVSRARWTTFTLSIVGATAATIAGQISAEQPVLRNWFAGAGAVALGLVTFLAGRLLGANRVSSWTQVRAAAEALKRETFRYATQVSPYDDGVAAPGLLDTARETIDAALIANIAVTPTRPGGAPRVMLSRDDYRSQRVQGQINWYQQKAESTGRQARLLRTIEFLLALIATIVTALSTVTGKQVPFVGIGFDIASLTALLTTLSGAIVSHIEASRLDYLASSYHAAARRLEDLNVTFSRVDNQQTTWSAFVNQCEDIILMENQSWIAKWQPPSNSKV